MYVNALAVRPVPGSATKVQRQSSLGFGFLGTVQQVRHEGLNPGLTIKIQQINSKH